MDVEKLISKVYPRSSLWDKNDKNHHHRFILDRLWDEVAVELNSTRRTVRNKWKALRDKFRTTLASIPKPRSGEEDTTPSHTTHWKYFESLLFLKDQFKNRVSSGNIKATDEPKYSICSQNIQEDIKGNIDEEDNQPNVPSLLEHIAPASPEYYLNSAQSVSSAPIGSCRQTNIRYKRRINDVVSSALLEIEKKKMKYLEEERSQEGEEDEDMNFFKSLLPHVKKFSSFDKLAYRMKILQVTQEFMIRNNNSECSSSQSTVISDSKNTANFNDINNV